MPQIYAADLIGAGLGSIAIVGLLYLLFPIDALKILSILGVVTAVIAGFELRFNRTGIVITVILALSLLTALRVLPAAWLNLAISPYKSLPQQLNIKDA